MIDPMFNQDPPDIPFYSNNPKRNRKKKHGYVYFARGIMHKEGYYKIGCSINPEKRCLSIGITIKHKIESQDCYSSERNWHRFLSRFQVFNEWYYLGGAPPKFWDIVEGVEMGTIRPEVTFLKIGKRWALPDVSEYRYQG